MLRTLATQPENNIVTGSPDEKDICIPPIPPMPMSPPPVIFMHMHMGGIEGMADMEGIADIVGIGIGIFD